MQNGTFHNALQASALHNRRGAGPAAGAQYLNELPPRNSRSSDVDGTWRLGIGRI